MTTISALADITATSWALALTVAIWAHWARTIICLMRGGDAQAGLWRYAAAAHQELWLFALPGLLLSLSDHLRSGGWELVVDVLMLFSWWWYRNWPDENRWKRRGRKLKDAVAERAGRLVVIPATASP